VLIFARLLDREASFAEKIGAIRVQELALFKKMAILQALNFSVATMATVLICFVTLLAYALLPGNPELTPSTAFTALQFLRVLQTPLQQFPNIVNAVVIEGRTALTRMGAFLQEEDIQPYVKTSGLGGTGLAVRVRGASFAWQVHTQSTSCLWLIRVGLLLIDCLWLQERASPASVRGRQQFWGKETIPPFQAGARVDHTALLAPLLAPPSDVAEVLRLVSRQRA